MNQEKLLKALMDLGLSQLEAETYLILLKSGPVRASDALKTLKTSKQRLYPAIRSLQSKGIVGATLEHPARFSALPFEKVLDLFVIAKNEEAKRIQQNKTDLLSDWQSIGITESERLPAKFTVIEGRSYVYSKIQQIIQETKSNLSFVATVPSLVRADVFGLFDTVFNRPERSKIQFRFLTEISEQNVKAIKTLLQKRPKAGFILEGKTLDLGLKLCPRMIIRDRAEAIFFLDQRTGDFVSEQDDMCLWTNCKSLVFAFLAMFEDLWRNSIDIDEKILQIETGKSPSQTIIVQNRDSAAAHKKHAITVQSAEKEIIMITSQENLVRFWKNKTFNQKWSERGVSVKIMAPITSKNFNIVKQMSKSIEVRHVPPTYLETTIVDGKHLFQFKNPYQDGEKPGKTPYFPETFYTNDFELTEKMTNTLNDLWNNAQPLSSVNLESIVKPFGFMPPPLTNSNWGVVKGVTIVEETPGEIKEKDVLNKIINANRMLDSIGRMYSSAAAVLIHPPEKFNLPDMLFRIYHIDKRSGFGEEDTMSVYLWLETPEGYTYVPAGDIGDNPVGVDHRRESTYRDSPAKQNCRLVKKDELQIRVYGNTLFCAWTVPLKLYPKYVLPPACLLIEGYGKVKTKAFSIIHPSGFKFAVEENYFDAFVTFMHPKSKYSGPGTDGAFIRDLIITTTPPRISLKKRSFV
jgi:sugar-specific transcriptional regulator TrmB